MENEKAKRYKILVVDDDPDIIEIEKAILETEGYDVAVAYNGDECIESIKQEKPDLIILDIMMQTAYEGANTAQILRENTNTNDIPIIVVTSMPIYSIYPDNQWYPTDDFINKPIERSQLIAKVKQYLS